MTRPRRTLPAGAEWLDHEGRRVLMIRARSSGQVSLDGEYSSDDRHPRYKVRVSATNPERVSTEEVLRGSSGHYIVEVEIQNYNDSPAFAWLELLGAAD